MSKVKCSAANPATCRFHNNLEYQNKFSKLNEIISSPASSISEIEERQLKIRKAIIEVDSTEKGFSILKESFQKAAKTNSGDYKSLKERLKLAQQYRFDSLTTKNEDVE